MTSSDRYKQMGILRKTWIWMQYLNSLEWCMPAWARFGVDGYLLWVEQHETRLSWLRWIAIGLLSAMVFLG